MNARIAWVELDLGGVQTGMHRARSAQPAAGLVLEVVPELSKTYSGRDFRLLE